MSEPPAPAKTAGQPPAGWMIGVMVQCEGDPAPLRRYFAVGRADRARAEWAAVDAAVAMGPVAVSPIGGLEPVQALSPLSAATARANGLTTGQVRDLGMRWPRRWIGSP